MGVWNFFFVGCACEGTIEIHEMLWMSVMNGWYENDGPHRPSMWVR